MVRERYRCLPRLSRLSSDLPLQDLVLSRYVRPDHEDGDVSVVDDRVGHASHQ